MARTAHASKIHPVTACDSGEVVAWVFGLTLGEGGQQAFDFIPVEVSVRRPLDEWTRLEVYTLVRDAIIGVEGGAPHPRVTRLHGTLSARLAFEEHIDFDLNRLGV
jgi:hypothetical protein